jgi:hypothetical protein
MENTTPTMKLFQFDRKTWDPEDTDYTWQFGIFGNRSLLWARFEVKDTCGFDGLIISTWFLTASSLFIATTEFWKLSFSVALFTEYFEGWDK